jgi:hypothetical protein
MHSMRRPEEVHFHVIGIGKLLESLPPPAGKIDDSQECNEMLREFQQTRSLICRGELRGRWLKLASPTKI